MEADHSIIKLLISYDVSYRIKVTKVNQDIISEVSEEDDELQLLTEHVDEQNESVEPSRN